MSAYSHPPPPPPHMVETCRFKVLSCKPICLRSETPLQNIQCASDQFESFRMNHEPIQMNNSFTNTDSVVQIVNGAEKSKDLVLAHYVATKKTTNADANENSQTRTDLHRKYMQNCKNAFCVNDKS